MDAHSVVCKNTPHLPLWCIIPPDSPVLSIHNPCRLYLIYTVHQLHCIVRTLYISRYIFTDMSNVSFTPMYLYGTVKRPKFGNGP